jgi:hypothetical protein
MPSKLFFLLQKGLSVSSLADLPEVVGFFSYSREDDADANGKLSDIRDAIRRELGSRLGRSDRTFRLFQDKEAIPLGAKWRDEISNAVSQAAFFIPIGTPRSFKSPQCEFEFQAFLERERELGRSDLIFAILYLPVPALKDEAKRSNNPVLSIIGERQYVEWDKLRHEAVASPEFAREISNFCGNIVQALEKPWLPAEERLRQEQILEKARREQERKQAEQEARQVKEAASTARKAEEKRRAAEATAARRADEERRKQEEAETKRLAAQEQRRLKDAAEAKARAEEEARRKQEADRVEARQSQEAAAARRETAAATRLAEENGRKRAEARTRAAEEEAQASPEPPKRATNGQAIVWGGAITLLVALAIFWFGFGERHGSVSAVAPTAGVLSSTGTSSAPAAPQKPIATPSNSAAAVAPSAGQSSTGDYDFLASDRTSLVFIREKPDLISVMGSVEDESTESRILSDLQATFGEKPYSLPVSVRSGGIDSLCWTFRSRRVIDALKKSSSPVTLEVDKLALMGCVMK